MIVLGTSVIYLLFSVQNVCHPVLAEVFMNRFLINIMIFFFNPDI